VTEPYDVNAARNQRREKTGDTWKFRLDGDLFELPVELARDTARQLRQLDDHDVDGLLKLLMGEQQFKQFLLHEVTMQDIAALLEAFGRDTGLALDGGPR